MRTIAPAWILGLVVLALGGCGQGLKDKNAALLEENQTLRSELAARNEALEAAAAERNDLEASAAQLRATIDDLEGQLQSREANRPAALTGFEGIPGTTTSTAPGRVTVSIESDVLFDSGKATLKSAAKQSLNQVASVLQSNYAGLPVRVAGHTDTDPIRKSGWKSNYHLGAERAYEVLRYLNSRGVDENRLYIASYGPNRPRGSKAQSRRVEIDVMLDE